MSDDKPTPGDRVKAFRSVPDSPFAEGVQGTVVEIHDPCPVPGVDEPVVVLDKGSGTVPVRLSGVREVLDDE